MERVDSNASAVSRTSRITRAASLASRTSLATKVTREPSIRHPRRASRAERVYGFSYLTDENSKLLLYLGLTTSCILGTYTRLGLSSLTNYQGSFVSGPTVLWPNLTACIVMGMLQTLNKFAVISPVLFTSLTVGYCGQVSSFSSMVLEMFEHATNQGAKPTHFPNRAYGIMEMLSVMFVHLFVSFSGLIFGMHLTKELGRFMEREKEDTVFAIRLKKLFTYCQVVFCLAAVPLLALHIVLAAVYGNFARTWMLSVIFGIPGAFLRYFLSRWYNLKIKYFPLGTFLANVFACALIAVFTLVQRGKLRDGTTIAKSVNTCRIVTALVSGFCGALSTISTFINEGYKLPFCKTLFYYTVSLFVSFCLIVVILGSYSWTRGLAPPIC
ncbi:LAMI_0B06304g1_1 [Lachancea mirantina]|uniref:LAMI_0B06304g1_1 n=1 Tax=Lachancea mirantina TaxID=1230905 RepID=A0A1G4IWN9_9SACH|nr:LAMI_0B06304g1_1 [Lachancea mirantina]